MNKGLANILRNIIKYGVVTLVALCVLVGIYFFSLRSSLLTQLEQLKSEASVQSAPFVLEEGSQVKKSELENFFLFAGLDLNTLLETNFKEVRGGYLVTESFNREATLSSPCGRFNCLYLPTEFSNLSSNIWKTLVAVEDYRFLEHKGVDLKAILRAAIVDIKAMKIVQGGSTLTQQLVKNLFLTSEKKLKRKLKEVVYAYFLERELSKDEILLLYLNNVEWGAFQGVGIKGIRAASNFYFSKQPSEIDPFEAAILIGMLKGPNYYHPLKSFERHKKRIEVVFKRMQKLGLLDASDSWDDKKWDAWKRSLELKSKMNFLNSYLQIKKNETLNSYEQYVFFESVFHMKAKMKNSFKGKDIGIKTLIMSRDCNRENCESFKYYSKRERSLSRAMKDEKHQVGSILKPIIYNEIISQDLSLDKLIETAPITLKLKSGNWTPKDSSKVKTDYITIREALQKSKNIPLVRLAKDVGFDYLEGKLVHLIPRLKLPLAEYPAQLLGAVELSLEEIGELFINFSAKSCQENSKIIYTLTQSTQTTIARMAKGFLENIQIFGKTGTTNKGLDNWYIALDGERVIVIWVGLEGRRKGKRLIASGATTSFRILQDFLEYSGRLVTDFECKEGNSSSN